MKIIVTGGAGFIGSHIVDAYLAAGHEVVVIDNLLTGSKANLPAGVRLYEADITDQEKIDVIFKNEQPEIVSHHAALISVADSMGNPMPTYAVNIMGTLNVLMAFGKYGSGNHKKFIFPSSAAVYGDPTSIPIREDAPLNPLSPYGISKKAAEELIELHANQWNCSYLILRYTNVYGPRQHRETGGVAAKIQHAIQSGKRPIMFGDGTKVRDYIYVGDVVAANIIALSKGDRCILNLGWGIPVTDREMFDAVSSALKSDIEPERRPIRAGEIMMSTLSAEQAKKVLGWEPSTSLADGIARTIAATS